VVDETYIREKFGDAVLGHVMGLREAKASFEVAVASKKTPVVPEQYANALTAIYAAELQESARTAGYGLLTTMDIQKQHELKLKGADTGPEGEKALVARDTKLLEAALALPGVNEACIAAPIKTTLLSAAKGYLDGKEAAENLVGWEGAGRGKAVAQLHNALPISSAKLQGNENLLEALYRTALEVKRYHANGQRKGAESIIGHLGDTLSHGSEALGEHLRPIVGVVLLMHDLVEDGGKAVAGFDHTLEKLSKDFSALTAQMIADMTDRDDAKDSHRAGKNKALNTVEDGGFVFADSGTKQGYTDPNAPLAATPENRGYSLTTAGPKIADRQSTMNELLFDPQMVKGEWLAKSGARIGWFVDNKGFVDQLVGHIAGQVRDYEKNVVNPDTVLQSGHRAGDLMPGLKRFVANEMKTADQFMVQTLTILADEFKLDEAGRQKLVAAFVDPSMTREQFEKEILGGPKGGEEGLLKDSAIKANREAGGIPSLAHSSVFKKTRSDPPPRSHEFLLEFREAALHRDHIREVIGIAKPDVIKGKEFTDVVRLYDRQMGSPAREMSPIAQIMTGPAANMDLGAQNKAIQVS
jgi:hypothetical protein